MADFNAVKGEHDVSVRKFGRELDIVEDREYASYIFETPNGLYRTFQNPVVGGMDGFLVSDLEKRRKDEGLENLKIVGIIHSHGAENLGYDSENFLFGEFDENGNLHGDLALSEMTGLAIFLISPRDTLRKYTPKQYRMQKWFVGEE